MAAPPHQHDINAPRRHQKVAARTQSWIGSRRWRGWRRHVGGGCSSGALGGAGAFAGIPRGRIELQAAPIDGPRGRDSR
eukprot:1434263-Pyramimonas_sp.AAC.1